MSSTKPERQHSPKRSRFSISLKKKKRTSLDKAASEACLPEAVRRTETAPGTATDHPDLVTIRFDRGAWIAQQHEKQMAEMQQRLDEALQEVEFWKTKSAQATEGSVEEVAELRQRLEEAQQQVNNWKSRASVDQETITQLDAKIQGMEIEAKGLRTRLDGYESADLDDESYAASQEFQHKKELSELQERVKSFAAMEGQFDKMRTELANANAELEELRMLRDRSQTRSRIQSISGDKSAEVTRLQKELRQLERKLQMESSQYEARLKASKDSLERANEKAAQIQKKADLIDKERLELKIANSRLEKKVEKADSYSERRRSEIEKESQELEIRNLKRKNSKLAKCLAMAGVDVDAMSDISTPVSSRPPSSMEEITIALSDLSSPTIAEGDTVAETRIAMLEKEVGGLQARTAELAKENEQLKEDLASAGQGDERIKQLEEELAAREAEASSLKANAALGEGAELAENYRRMEKELAGKETEFRVKEKDLWATIEDLKRQCQELEMAKLKAELGEDEEGEKEEDLTDTEDSEVQELRDRIKSLEAELDAMKQANTALNAEVKAREEEMSRLMGETARAKEAGAPPADEMSGELATENNELKQKLEEQTQKNEQVKAELAQLKEISEQQEDELILLRVQSQMSEQKAADAESKLAESEKDLTMAINKLAAAEKRADDVQNQLTELLQEGDGKDKKASRRESTKTPPPPVAVKKPAKKSPSPQPVEVAPVSPTPDEARKSKSPQPPSALKKPHKKSPSPQPVEVAPTSPTRKSKSPQPHSALKKPPKKSPSPQPVEVAPVLPTPDEARKSKSPQPPSAVKSSPKKSPSPQPVEVAPASPVPEETVTPEPVDIVDGPTVPISNGQSDATESPVPPKEEPPSTEEVTSPPPSSPDKKPSPQRQPEKTSPARTKPAGRAPPAEGRMVKLKPTLRKTSEEKPERKRPAPRGAGTTDFKARLAMFNK